MIPEIAIVVSPRDWAERLHRFVADHGGARVRARVLDSREAIEEPYQVLVAEDLTSFLTPRLVAVLHHEGRRVLGVYDATEPWGRDRLGELGVDETIASNATPDDMLRAIDALALAAGADLDAELARLSSAAHVEMPVSAMPAPSGAVAAVGGPAGAPGATEVAIALADALCRRSERAGERGGGAAVVVDADDVAPALAQRLGLPLHPNLRAALDAVHHLSGDLQATLAPTRPWGPHVLSGVANPRDWTELRPGEVVDVLRDLTATHRWVVANVGHRLEELPAAGGEGRYGLARAILRDADQVVVVVAPTAVGVARAVDWVADVRALTAAPLHVVVNRVPGSSFKRAEVEHELLRSLAPASLTPAPEDRRVAAAAWAGVLVPNGRFSRAMDRLAARLVPAPLPTVRPASR